ncbi:MAG TPA: hypothetical protein DCP61_07235 [Treponema sp.]|nr:hypothetical protein [Treponema sp.]
MNPEKAYLAEKHLQTDSEEPDFETARKIAVFTAMARTISENWPEWELVANVPGYGAVPSAAVPIENVGIYRSGKLLARRLLSTSGTAARMMKEICGAFCLAIEQEEKKHVRKEKDWGAVSESH